MVTAKQIAEVLGGAKTLGRPVASMLELDEIVTEGLPRSAFDELVSHLVAGSEERCRMEIRDKIIPRSTYQRARRLNLHYGETTERLARVYAMVRALWQDDLVAGRFMSTPHPELGGKTPLEAALTEIGGRQVEEIIERGLHGLPV